LIFVVDVRSREVKIKAGMAEQKQQGAYELDA
jgi:hypothetical protein